MNKPDVKPTTLATLLANHEFSDGCYHSFQFRPAFQPCQLASPHTWSTNYTFTLSQKRNIFTVQLF